MKPVKEPWAGNWVIPKEVRQPHRTKSKGIGGPGGPIRTKDSAVAEALEHGLKCNPIRLGMTGDSKVTTRLQEILTRLWRNPSIHKQFSAHAQCWACVERGKPDPIAVNGRRLCLLHEYLRGEGLLGFWIEGKTYKEAKVRQSP